MRNWFAKLQSNPWLVKRLVVLALLIAAGGGGFWYGRQPTGKHGGKGSGLLNPEGEGYSSQGGRVVAYLYDGKVPVSREEYGEYLINRFGLERLEFMVNRKIVEMECAKAGVFASEGEIKARLDMDLITYGGTTPLTLSDFENSVLKKFGKTLLEWKEDVIRPKILMEKMVRSQVDPVNDADIKKGFEARFGPKVDCRMIVLNGNDMGVAQKVWEHAKRSRADFLEEARKQFIPQLAQAEGKVPPIHKHLGDQDLEDAAFRMKKDEISNLMKMKDGTCVILLCEGHLPEDKTVRLETVRTQLVRELMEQRVAQMVPQVFTQMRMRASPTLVLNNRGPLSTDILPASYTKEAPTPVTPLPVQSPPGANALPDNGTPLPAPKIEPPVEKK